MSEQKGVPSKAGKSAKQGSESGNGAPLPGTEQSSSSHYALNLNDDQASLRILEQDDKSITLALRIKGATGFNDITFYFMIGEGILGCAPDFCLNFC